MDRPTTERSSESGLGLIEIVISMFLISLLAIAFVPVLVSALRASEMNSTTATANRLVSQAIDHARTQGATDCQSAPTTLNTSSEVVDAQGVTLRVETLVSVGSTCAAGSTIIATVIAYDLADASRTPIADARTLLLVGP